MARTVDDLKTLQEYTKGVFKDADDHAKNVSEIIFPLLGLIVFRKDTGKNLKVLERDGKMQNVLWVYINGRRYAFSFNHTTKDIEIRERSTHGDALKSFNNQTSLDSLVEYFKSL